MNDQNETTEAPRREREPKARKTLEDALRTAYEIHEADEGEPLPPMPKYGDVLTLAQGFIILAQDLAGYWEAIEKQKHFCGWCEHAGISRADLPRLAIDEIREHTLKCEHNPLVRRIGEQAREIETLKDDVFKARNGKALEQRQAQSWMERCDAARATAVILNDADHEALTWMRTTAADGYHGTGDPSMSGLRRSAIEVLDRLLGQAMNPPSATDTRADYIAAHLWLTQHGVTMLKDGKPATLTERVRMLLELADDRGERLERMEPLRTVLRSWDWAQVKEDGQLDSDHGERQVIDAFAAVEKAELEAAKAKEGGRG